MLHTHRQQGNTLTGMIIGLIVGLAIAVAVALAITKGSTPFTDKTKTGKPPEPTAGQVTTAVAMGDRLITRLVKAGMKFDVL